MQKGTTNENNNNEIIQIRDDIYPEVEDIFRKHLVDARIEIIQSIFSSTFKNDNEVIKFINSISNPKDAKLLIEISAFLYVLKENTNESFKPIWLIGLFSVFEKLSGPEWQSYPNWMNMKNNDEIQKILAEFKERDDTDYLEMIKNVYNKYNEKYGATKRVRDFTNTFLQTRTKIALISALRVFRTKYVFNYSEEIRSELTVNKIEDLKKFGVQGGTFLMPKCYNWKKCYIGARGCKIDRCPLNHDENKLEEYFYGAINILYAFRSNFVHEASIPPVKDGSILGVLNGKQIFLNLQFEKFWEDCLKGIIEFFKTKV